MVELASKIPEIVSRLRLLDPVKIYLFGSLAADGKENVNDIDIAVVVDVDSEPESFEERIELQSAVRQAIYELSEEVPIDIVVYTRQEFDKLHKQNRPFIREILSGQLLYEKAG